MPMNATHPRDINPTVCSANMSTSLSVDVSTIAIGAMGILMLSTVYVVLNTTICSVRDLCIVKGRCFGDLLLDKVKGVHSISPEILGVLIPFLQSFASHGHSGDAS